MISYALILVLVTIVSMAAVKGFGQEVSDSFYVAAAVVEAGKAPFTDVQFEALSHWYEAEFAAPLNQASEISMLLEFTNDYASSNTITLDPSQTQIWTTSGIVDPTYTINSFTSGPIAFGGTFNYDITIDPSNLTSDETGLAFRPYSTEAGTMSPTKAPMSNQSITITE